MDMKEAEGIGQNNVDEKVTIDDSLLMSVSWVCCYYKTEASDNALMAGIPRGRFLTSAHALTALQNAGFSTGLVERHITEIPEQLAPVILLRKGNCGGCVFLGREKSQDPASKEVLYRIILPEISADPVVLSAKEMLEIYSGFAIFLKLKAKADRRVEEPELVPAGHWLLGTLWRYRRYYRSAAIGTLLINILTLASIFFTMNVYDRVIPNQAYVTLWSLAIGVTIAMLFEAFARYIRAHLIDVAGKKADLILGTLLFRQMLSIKMEYKPASSGSFANQLREFESVRDFATSATLSAVADLPFVFFFIGVIFTIGGYLGLIPLILLPIILTISLLIQWPLAKTMKENLRETSLKQGVLIESIEGMETLKAVGGEGYMQRRWENFSALAAETSMKSRRLSALATGSFAFFQQIQTVIIVITGVYLISNGVMTQGALIGTVMLASRATAPLGQIVGLAVRFQQAKVALESLNNLMLKPVDRDERIDYLPNPELTGRLQLKDIDFAYPAPPMQPALPVLKKISLSIQPGERIAILGKIGSGKSTLLRVIARLYDPTGGQIFADGLDVTQIDPADWRAHVGFVGQDSRLFYGSLRENIMIGNPSATVKELLRVLKLTGLDRVAAKHPLGINLPIGEMGDGLSGGQRQLVSLARSLIARPTVLLMDEPTSSMDMQTENQFIAHLKKATDNQTIIVVTHRPSLLSLIDRIVVVDEGRIVADGPKEQVMATLSGSAVARPGTVQVTQTKVPANQDVRPSMPGKDVTVMPADGTTGEVKP
ncbi:type I secretion system permease/ATPase [Jejubacter calystegiae]|uniref:Type I secretion system permease/ATPase n=1 Tax=Jejubacter calystegiae TaxID=2579935 RepID=A0A4P8YEB2_9ENTR|nr:type I secretion system permease/ATPase [Jejubacter calystegiae]QCT18889.1 type I secretion system permease/ATPase [Jejubacter calystegiae]